MAEGRRGDDDVELVDEELRGAVVALPLDDRAVVVLRYFADLSVAETASALDVPEGTVKTRTRRALAHLRQAGLVEGSDASVDGAPTDEPEDATEEAPR